MGGRTITTKVKINRDQSKVDFCYKSPNYYNNLIVKTQEYVMRKLSIPKAEGVFSYLSKQTESNSCLQVFRKVWKFGKLPRKHMWEIKQVLPNKFTKNYEISCISSHTSLHRENLIINNSNLKNKSSLHSCCHMISTFRIYPQVL